MSIFTGRAKLEEVTDEDVKEWINSRGRCTSADTPTQVKDALNKVRFRPDARDPEGAVLTFFTDVVTELRRNRASHVISDNSKVLMGQLIPKLEPTSVRETVQNAYEYWSREEKSNFKSIKEAVIKASIESAKYSKSGKGPKNSDTLRPEIGVPLKGKSNVPKTKINPDASNSKDKNNEDNGKRKWMTQ